MNKIFLFLLQVRKRRSAVFDDLSESEAEAEDDCAPLGVEEPAAKKKKRRTLNAGDAQVDDDGKQKKKRSSLPNQRADALGNMANSFSAMAGAYADNKKKETRNIVWGKLLGESIDRLDEDDQDDVKIEVDNLVYNKLREKRQK